jgi:hypothetical protein
MPPVGRCMGLRRRPPHRRAPPARPRLAAAAAPHDPQFGRNCKRVARDAEGARLILKWDLGYEEPETAKPGLGASGAFAWAAFLYFDCSGRALRGQRELAARLLRRLTRSAD